MDERNQCDGCRAGIPLDKNGNHCMSRTVDRTGKTNQVYSDLMACQAEKYCGVPEPEFCRGAPTRAHCAAAGRCMQPYRVCND